MSGNSTLPIEIVVGLDEASLGRTLAEIKAKVASQGKQFATSIKVTGLDQYDKQAQAIDKVTQSMFKLAKVRSPESVANELNALKQAKAAWEALGPATDGYKGALDQITRRTNILTEGNARARGSFHKMTAAIASLTFEITGALYGLAAIGGAVAGGAIFGIKFLKDIEDAKMGIAGTVLSMNLLAKESMTTGQAMDVANGVISRLEKDSLKYNVSLADTAKLFQAIVGPGTAARMTMEEIGKTAVIGAVAVKSMGLNSMQVVQEVRDLVQGGIQAASSTLATALGLKDSDIKAAKESAQGLFAFLEERMAGFAMMSMERNNTLSGSWDMLWMKVQRLFADPQVFSALVDGIKQISEAIGTIETDAEGNFKGLKLNESLVTAVKAYSEAITATVRVIATIIEYTVKWYDAIALVAGFFIANKLFGLILPLFETYILKLSAAATATIALGTASEVMAAKSIASAEAVAAAGGTLAKGSLAARGGLYGMLLWGVYELADFAFHSKWVEDNIFATMMQIGNWWDETKKKMGMGSQQEVIQGRIAKLQAFKPTDFKSDTFGTADDKWKANLAAIESYKKQLVSIAPVEKSVTKTIGAEQNYRVATIQQGLKASSDLQTAYEKTDPTAKRTKAIAEANDKLKQSLMGIGESIKQGTLTQEDAKKRELDIVKHYNAAIEAANRPMDKAAAKAAAKAEKALTKELLNEYKARSAALDEQLATDFIVYSEWYDKKVALIEKSKTRGMDPNKADQAMAELRTKLAKDSTAAMKDIDAATAKYADTLSDGARYEKDFTDATKNKADIMRKELDVLKALSDPTEEQRKKIEALTVSLGGYSAAAKTVTDVLKPMLDAMQQINQLKNVSDTQIEAIKQQPLDLAVGGQQEFTPIEQANIDLSVYENRNALLREANAELEKMIALGAANADKTTEIGKQFEIARDKVAGVRKEVEGYAKSINLSKAYGDQFYNTFNKAGILFGKLGKSITEVAKGVGNLVGVSKTYSKSMGDAAKISDNIHDPKRVEVETKAYKKMSEESIDAYANIAGAAKGMFEENTAGYKVMEAVEKGFRSFQLAASIASIAQGWTETAASTTQSATKATGSTIAGVAKAFEQLGVYGFIGAAAIIAFMAAMGSGGASAGGGMPAIPQEATAEYQQKIQGTGTVLGNSTAQSETIANGIEILSQHSFEMLDYTQGMLNSLRRIDNGIGNLASSLAKISGITGTGGVSSFGTVENTTASGGGILDSIFGGASTSTTQITDTGIKIAGSIKNLTNLKGLIQQYETAVTTTTESGGWFSDSSTSTSVNTKTKSLGGEIATQIGMIFGSMSESIKQGIDLLGMVANSAELDSIMETIGNLPIDLNASLKGLSGEDISNALNGVFSAAFDSMVATFMPYARDFQKIGEGVGETFIRLASNARTADLALQSIGMSFPTVASYSKTNAPTAIDLARVNAAQTTRDAAFNNLQSLQAADIANTPMVTTQKFDPMSYYSGEFVIPIFQVTQGITVASKATIEATDALIMADEELAAAHLAAGDTAMDMSHKLTIAREYLLEGAGGIDAFVESAQFFADNFLTDSEKLRPVFDALNSAFGDMSVADEAVGHLAGLGKQIADLGYTTPKTKEEFVSIVQSLDLTSKSGADLYNSLMSVAPAFDAVANAMSNISNLQRSLDIKLMEAVGDASGTLAATREDELKSLQDTAHATDDQIAKLIATQKAIYAAVDAEEAKKIAEEGQRAAAEEAQKAAEEAQKAAEEAQRAAEELRNAWQSVADSIFAEVTRIRGIESATTQVDFALATNKARGGDIEAAKSLADASKSMLSAAQSTAASYFSLRSLELQTAASLEATGTILSDRYGLTIPSFAVGTNYVPDDMLANIHAGERIIPAADNIELMARLRNPNEANDILVDEIRQLRQEVSALRQENSAENLSIAQFSLDTSKVLRKWDGEGTPAVRTV